MKPLHLVMDEAGMTIEQLVATTGLEPETVKAIATGNYTPSPSQRQRLAGALSVAVEDIEWGHTVPVQHLWGHGPQFGRTP